MKKTAIILIVIGIIILGGIGFKLFHSSPKTENNPVNNNMNNLGIEILKQGTGEEAKNDDQVIVNYVGTLQNGTKFDSSYDRGVPFQFILGAGQVIQGWEKGILGMKVGEKRKLTIPPELGYGSQGAGDGVIPPNATLYFEVELLQIL